MVYYKQLEEDKVVIEGALVEVDVMLYDSTPFPVGAAIFKTSSSDGRKQIYKSTQVRNVKK